MEPERRKTLQYVFGDFVLQVPEATLTCRGEPVPLAPKEFDLLCVLATNSGHLVHKELLVKRVWPDTFVSDSSLFRNISVLRKYLGNAAIRTVPKRGYVFALPVMELREPLDRAAPVSSSLRIQMDLPELEDLNDQVKLSPPIEPAESSSEEASTLAWLRLRPRWPFAVSIALFAVVALAGIYGIPHRRAGRAKAGERAESVQGATAGAARLFVLNEHGNTLSILNTLGSAVESTVSMDADPSGAAILPDSSMIYISLNHVGRVAALDARSHRIIASIPVGNGPVGIAANPRPPYVYVANNYSNSVSVIDSRTNTVVRDLRVGSVPTEIGISADGTRAVVTNQSSGSVTMIDTVANEVLATIPVGATPVGVTFTPDSNFALVTLAGQNEVAIIDVARARVGRRIHVGPGPIRIAVSRDGRFALISNFFSNTLTVLDMATMRPTHEISVGLNPVGIAFNPGGDLAYVANYGSNTVSVIAMPSLVVVETIKAGLNPVEFAVLPCYASPCG